MSLRRVVAAPFKRAGASQVTESEFVVTLSLHRDWYSPAQAKRVLELAASDGLIAVEDEHVRARFDPSEVELPPEFTPDEALLEDRSTFELLLERIVDAGHDKRTAVAEINGLQRELDVTVEAAAAIYGAKQGVGFGGTLERASDELRDRIEPGQEQRQTRD